MNVLVGNCYYVAYDIKAGADLGTRLASPGPKANLVSPTTVGECASQEPALAPSRDAVPGFGGFSSTEEHIDEKMVLQ